MNSGKGFIVVILIVLLLGGAYFFYNSQKAKQTAPTAASTQQTGGNLFTSIQDALSKSLSLKCDYPDAKGNTVTTYIKAGAVRVMGFTSESNKGTGETLMKDNKMYIWDDKTKQGTVFALDAKVVENAKEAVQKNVNETASPSKKDDFLNGLEQYKKYCKPATVSDSLFAVPTDVKFVDLNEQMKKSGVDIQKMMQQVQTTITPPSGY